MSAPLGIDHVQLAMPEGGEDRARAFYTDLLGMRELAKPSNLSPAGCWFECGALQLHLGVDPDFRPARKAHPALLVGDLAESRARKTSRWRGITAASPKTLSATVSS